MIKLFFLLLLTKLTPSQPPNDATTTDKTLIRMGHGFMNFLIGNNYRLDRSSDAKLLRMGNSIFDIDKLVTARYESDEKARLNLIFAGNIELKFEGEEANKLWEKLKEFSTLI
jgi:hypothetical protein